MKIKGRAVTGKDIPEGKFVFGRHVMTCCVQDIQFAGMVCKYPSTVKRPENGQWVKITGKVKIETDPIYGDGLPGPVVYCTKVTANITNWITLIIIRVCYCSCKTTNITCHITRIIVRMS